MPEIYSAHVSVSYAVNGNASNIRTCTLKKAMTYTIRDPCLKLSSNALSAAVYRQRHMTPQRIYLDARPWLGGARVPDRSAPRSCHTRSQHLVRNFIEENAIFVAA
jgi:hypothetical protein